MLAEIRTQNNVYQARLINGQLSVKGHPQYCPDWKPADGVFIGQVMFIQFTDGVCIRTSKVQHSTIAPVHTSLLADGTKDIKSVKNIPPLRVKEE